MLELRLGAAIDEVIEVLHRGDREALPRRFDLRDAHVRRASRWRMRPLALQLRDRGELLVLPALFGSIPWSCHKIDARDRERLPGCPPTAARSVPGRPSALPLQRPRPQEPALRRDDHARVRRQCLAHEELADERPVGVRGIDEAHAERRQRAQCRDRGREVRRRPEHAGPHDAHPAEAEAIDLEIAADRDGARRRCRHAACVPSGDGRSRPGATSHLDET